MSVFSVIALVVVGIVSIFLIIATFVEVMNKDDDDNDDGGFDPHIG